MGIHSLTVVALVTTVLAACTPKAAERQPAADPEGVHAPMRKAPVVRGTDENGREFSSTVLNGKWWIASFFFTTCPSVCPALNTVQAGLQKEFGDRIRFVSITTDPETDTPEEMKRYGEGFGAKQGIWHFVRMSADSVRELSVKGFALMDPVEPEMHSTRFVLVDGEQRIRDYFDSADTARVAQLKTILSQLKAD